jgi:hypothetical protein
MSSSMLVFHSPSELACDIYHSRISNRVASLRERTITCLGGYLFLVYSWRAGALMTIGISLGIAVFSLGAATGALLERLQRMTFRERISKNSVEQPEDAVSANCGPDETKATTFIALSESGVHSSFTTPHLGDHIPSDTIPDPATRTLLEQKQMEVDRLRREIQMIRAVIPMLEADYPDTEQTVSSECSEHSASLQTRYGTWFSPRRPV